MRFITGLVVGVLLTVGAAYVSDAARAPSGPDGEVLRMVNWTVVDANMRDLSRDVRGAWARLVSGAKAIDRKIGA